MIISKQQRLSEVIDPLVDHVETATPHLGKCHAWVFETLTKSKTVLFSLQY